MQTGFYFKGIHSSRFGSVATKSRPILPEARSLYVTLPGRDGEQDYRTLNEYGRTFYNKRIFTVVMKITAEDIHFLQRKMSDVAVWLMGDGELIFDDMPSVKWKASVLSEIGYAPESKGKSAILTVNFEVEPFSVGRHSTELVLDSGITLDRNVKLDFDTGFDWECSGTELTVTVNNIGTAPLRPIITIAPVDKTEAAVDSTWSISCGGRRLEMTDSFSPHNATYVLDTEAYTLTRDNMNYLSTLRGEFFELMPGENEMTFEFGAAAKRVIKLWYEPKYIYDAVDMVV